MQIKLENAVWVLEKLLNKKLYGDDTVKLLMDANVDFYTIGKGKGGRVMVTSEIATALEHFDWQAGMQGKRRKKGVPKDATPIEPTVVERIVERIDPAWKTDIEGIVMENDARVDDLFKVVKDMHKVYADLRSRVDERANMPEPPPLPPRFRRKILMGGLDAPSVTRLRDNFRDVEIVHFGATDKMDIQRGRQLARGFDLIIVMTSYINHSLRAAIEKRFDKKDIHYVKGSQSSAEGVISYWLNEEKKKDEE